MKKNKANVGTREQGRNNIWGGTLFLCPMGDLPYSRLATHLPVYYLSSEFSSHKNQLSFTLQTASCELRTWKKQMWVRNDTELQGK